MSRLWAPTPIGPSRSLSTLVARPTPPGEWICLEAQTAISPGGVGLATSLLSDLNGPIGVGAQSLLVTQR